MPHEVVRAEPGEDLYVVWSTVVDDALVAGDAAEVLEFLTTDCPRTYEPRVAEAMASEARAAAHGGSGETVWGTRVLFCGGRGLLPRRLAEYLAAKEGDDPTRRLMEPSDA